MPTRPGARTCGWSTRATPCASRSSSGICTRSPPRSGSPRARQALRARARYRPRARGRMVPPLLRRTARCGHPGDARVDGAPRLAGSRSGAAVAEDLEDHGHARPRAPATPGSLTRVQPDRADSRSPTRIVSSSWPRSTTPRSRSSWPEMDGKVVGELLMVPVERESMHVGSPGPPGTRSSPSRRAARRRGVRRRPRADSPASRGPAGRATR